MYADTFKGMSPSLFELELDGWDPDYKKFEDGHPSTIKYYNYLEKIGFKFSESTKQYALDSNSNTNRRRLTCISSNPIPGTMLQHR